MFLGGHQLCCHIANEATGYVGLSFIHKPISEQISESFPNLFPNWFPNKFLNKFLNGFPNEFPNWFLDIFPKGFSIIFQNGFPNKNYKKNNSQICIFKKKFLTQKRSTFLVGAHCWAQRSLPLQHKFFVQTGRWSTICLVILKVKT